MFVQRPPSPFRFSVGNSCGLTCTIVGCVDGVSVDTGGSLPPFAAVAAAVSVAAFNQLDQSTVAGNFGIDDDEFNVAFESPNTADVSRPTSSLVG